MKKSCYTCGKSIDPVLLIKCDDCKKSFHRQCITVNAGDSEKDLIQLCTSCMCENQIYVIENEPSNEADKRELRNGKTFKSNIPIRTGVKRNANDSIKIINGFATSVNNLKICYQLMEERIVLLESKLCIKESDGHRHHECRDKIQSLNNFIKECERQLQLNAARYQQIEQKLFEMGHKLKNEMNVQTDEKWRTKFVEIEVEKIKAEVKKMRGQLEGIDLQSTEIDEHDFSYETNKKKKHSYWQDLSNVSSIDFDEIEEIAANTGPKTTSCSHAKPPSIYSDGKTKRITNEKQQSFELRAACHRFAKPYDIYGYTRKLIIEVRETSFNHLQQHKDELNEHLNTYIGRNIVKNSTVTGYRLSGGTITSIRYAVEFKIPLNYQYLDSLNCPTNWYFYGMKSNNYKNRSNKYQMMRQRQSMVH